MPSHRVHRYVDQVFFGKQYVHLHVLLDAPYKMLGSRHRVLYHDFASAAVIGQKRYPSDPNAKSSAIMHIVTDRLCSSNLGFKAWLGLLADVDAREKARLRRIEKAKKRQRTKRKPRKKPRKSKPKQQKSSMTPEKNIARFIKLMQLAQDQNRQ